MLNKGPIFIVGGSGQIGRQLRSAFADCGATVTAAYFNNPETGLVYLDAGDAGQVVEVLERARPSVVINALNAQGGTDACELEPDLAERQHFQTGRNLADQAERLRAKFVQISTDYVFDGEAGPYREVDAARPLSQLGDAKLRLENYLLGSISDALVVRTSFVFSWTPESKTKNFVMQLLDNDRHRRSMKVPVDQVGNVTYAPNFAEALAEMVQMDLTGLYHLAGTTRCSKYDWALSVAALFGLDSSLIQGVTTEELKQAGPRPLESGFVLDKVQAVLKKTRLMSMDSGLAAMKTQMEGSVVKS